MLHGINHERTLKGYFLAREQHDVFGSRAGRQQQRHRMVGKHRLAGNTGGHGAFKTDGGVTISGCNHWLIEVVGFFEIGCLHHAKGYQHKHH